MTRQLLRSGSACALAIALATGLMACGGSDNPSAATTGPTVVATPQPVLFEGKLDVGGSSFYSFAVSATGNTNVMLASVTTSTTPGNSTNVTLGMGLGTPLGTDCVVTTSVQASPALQSPLVSNLTAGTYCVRVYDVGNLKGPVNFAVRIVHT